MRGYFTQYIKTARKGQIVQIICKQFVWNGNDRGIKALFFVSLLRPFLYYNSARQMGIPHHLYTFILSKSENRKTQCPWGMEFLVHSAALCIVSNMHVSDCSVHCMCKHLLFIYVIECTYSLRTDWGGSARFRFISCNPRITFFATIKRDTQRLVVYISSRVSHQIYVSVE